MQNLDGFKPFFTFYDFGIRKEDAKGFLQFGATVAGSPNSGYHVFIAALGKRSKVLADLELFHKLHVALEDNQEFYNLCVQIVTENPERNK